MKKTVVSNAASCVKEWFLSGLPKPAFSRDTTEGRSGTCPRVWAHYVTPNDVWWWIGSIDFLECVELVDLPFSCVELMADLSG